uniref:S19-locus linked F-box protein 3 n=1 Tax=Petunia axillaris subsp. axillaris TaxID=55889 RepID=A0A140JNQ0_PETAX|nr:S19-locus linked F-box protein 3 [Petunia axillaris subsp. axillaris]
MNKLAQDMVVNILLRLPVKSLMRFKCVIKTYYSLIQSSSFINLQLNRVTTDKDELVLFKRSFEEDIHRHKTILSFLSSSDVDSSLNPISPDLDVPRMTNAYSNNFDQLIGPCKGLIALMNHLVTVLINPSTRNYRLLPSSPFDSPPGFYRSIESVGFGFDSIANDYKVIRILEVYWIDHGYPLGGEKKVEIYDLGIDSWRELDHVDQQFPQLHWLPCSQMFYKGACHWIAIPLVDPMVILSFDLSTEIFRTIKMPDNCCFSDGPCYSLVLSNDSLTLICYPDPAQVVDPTKDLIDIWIMKDYGVHESWIKKNTIIRLRIVSPLAVWRESLLLCERKNGILMFYNLCSNEVKDFNLHGSPKSLRAMVYKETLTPIPKGNEKSTEVQKF